MHAHVYVVIGVQGQLVYSIGNCYPGSVFFYIHPTTGIVTVKEDLRTDSQDMLMYMVGVLILCCDLMGMCSLLVWMMLPFLSKRFVANGE